MDLKEERNKKILLIVLIIALICLGIYKLFFDKKSSSEEIDTKTISIVSNPNDFYTVSSCVSKYLAYLSSGDNDKLYTLISDEYKKNNLVNKDNIYGFIDNLNGVYSFNPRKMFVQRLGENTYKFYVYGLTTLETINPYSNEKDFYLIVILDRKNSTFAIEPYDGSIFK